ncbi:MAG: hypothetical protein WDN28_14170 [Chthoniobacter sp.]
MPALLDTLAPKWDFHDHHWFVKVSRKFTDTFVPWLRSLPRTEVEIELRGALASFLDAPLAGTVRLDVQASDVDWFDLRVVLEVSDLALTPEEIKALLDAGGKWVRLGAKGWRRLEFKLSAEDEEQLSRLGLNAREFSSAPPALARAPTGGQGGGAFPAGGAVRSRGAPRGGVAGARHAGDSRGAFRPSCDPTSATDFTFSPTSRRIVSAEFWPTTWDSAKRCKRSPGWSGCARSPVERARRSSSVRKA